MFKRRAKIMGRGLLRLICFSIGVLYLVFLCLVNFDKSRSNIDLNIKGVSYGTIADAKNNPNVLYIELKEGYSCTEEDVNNFCLELPKYKRPRKIIFAQVPRNPTGKIEKPKLRELYRTEDPFASMVQ